MAIEPTDVCMIDDCKELLPLAIALPTAAPAGLPRLNLRFFTLVRILVVCERWSLLTRLRTGLQQKAESY
jgi:hypothetical protein